MGAVQSSGVIFETTRIVIISVIIGLLLLGIFKLTYRLVDTSHVLTLVGFVSLLLGIAFNAMWKRWGHRRRKR